jgi:hypothetical protein
VTSRTRRPTPSITQTAGMPAAVRDERDRAAVGRPRGILVARRRRAVGQLDRRERAEPGAVGVDERERGRAERVVPVDVGDLAARLRRVGIDVLARALVSAFAGPLRASPAAAIIHTRHGPVRGEENTTRVSSPRYDGSRLSHKDELSVSAFCPEASIATTVHGCWRSNHSVRPSRDHAGWPAAWNDAVAGRHGPSAAGFLPSPR